MKKRIAELEARSPRSRSACDQQVATSSALSRSTYREEENLKAADMSSPSARSKKGFDALSTSVVVPEYRWTTISSYSATDDGQNSSTRPAQIINKDATLLIFSEFFAFIRVYDDNTTNKTIIRELCATFLRYVNHKASHMIFGPALSRLCQALSEDEMVLLGNNQSIDACTLATFLLILCFGAKHHPSNYLGRLCCTSTGRATQALNGNGI